MAKLKKIKNKIVDSEEFKDLKKTSIRDIFDGSIFSKSYFLKQVKLIILVTCFVFIYMDNRMECEKQIVQINNLRKELTDIKYVSMVIESNMLQLGRRSKIEELIQKYDLQLHEPVTPPYKIELKK